MCTSVSVTRWRTGWRWQDIDVNIDVIDVFKEPISIRRARAYIFCLAFLLRLTLLLPNQLILISVLRLCMIIKLFIQEMINIKYKSLF